MPSQLVGTRPVGSAMTRTWTQWCAMRRFNLNYRLAQEALERSGVATSVGKPLLSSNAKWVTERRQRCCYWRSVTCSVCGTLGSCHSWAVVIGRHTYCCLWSTCGAAPCMPCSSVRKKNKLAIAIQARMARQVSEGLAYLHDLSIVHRDLKTRNSVLDEDLNCKICDFGLTVTLEKSHLTVLSLQGSPRYMAPEQFETKAKITEKVDIWQMGCVMLELFCLALPFANAAGVHQIATELLLRKKPPSLPSDANPYARVLIQACLRIEARQRPEAEQLIDALGGILARSMSHAIA